MIAPLQVGSAEARALYELWSHREQVDLGVTGGQPPLLVGLRIAQRMAEQGVISDVLLPVSDQGQLDRAVGLAREHLNSLNRDPWVTRHPTDKTYVSLYVPDAGRSRWRLTVATPARRDVTDLTIVDPELVPWGFLPDRGSTPGQLLLLGAVGVRRPFGQRTFTRRHTVPPDILLAGAPE